MQLEQQLLEVSSNLSPDVIKLITSSIDSNRSLIIWGLGLCATGFITLCGWIVMLTKQITQQRTMAESMNKIAQSVIKIEIALVGDFYNKGLIAKHQDIEKDLHDIKEKLKNA